MPLSKIDNPAAIATSTVGTILTIAAATIYSRKWQHLWHRHRNPIVKYQEYTSSEKSEMCRVGFSTPHAIPILPLDCIIISSGMGGLSMASILSQEVKRVLVLEQHDVLGVIRTPSKRVGTSLIRVYIISVVGRMRRRFFGI